MTEFSWRTDALHLTFGYAGRADADPEPAGGEAPVALRSIRAGGAAAGTVPPGAAGDTVPPGAAGDTMPPGATADAAPTGTGTGPGGAAADSVPAHLDQPLVEVSATGHGRFPGSFRHVDTVLGRALRYVGHSERADGAWRELRVEQRESGTGLRVTSVFRADTATDAFQTWTVVELDPPGASALAAGPASLTLDFVSSFATGAFLADTGRTVDDFDLLSGENDWVAENRWSRRPLREVGLARIDRDVQHHPPRSRCLVSNRGSWSTGERLPTGVLLCREADYALAWQVEHNGPWSYEIGESRHGAYLLLAGPTDQENQWSTVISAGHGFTSVPASVGVSRGGVDAALAVLTDQRRVIRQPRSADDSLPVIFNDYMNTLMGDPTTATLLPLIDAAASVGADYFCIDAGWYAEGHWWDTVGAWEPAASRFPNGITEVIEHIRARGMVAGLWLEPEVIGVHSPLARSLPDDAFFSRGGIRVAEHGRHHLDLRSPAARAHLDGVVDRLVSDYGIGFIKMDYNTMAGPGTDAAGHAPGDAPGHAAADAANSTAGQTPGDGPGHAASTAPGDGLLGHNRALLTWLDDIQARHPHLLIENCASGAMRMDYAMLSRLHLQSTSDQQDPVMYAPIAAAAPASLLPEQAGNWAYPQAGMAPELFTFSLVNAILGRMYLSGYINRMSAAEVALVTEAVAAQKAVVAGIRGSHAVWPLDLPGWEDPWIALGLTAPDDALRLALWRRPGAAETVVLPLPAFTGRSIEVLPFFPAEQHGWSWAWNPDAGELTVTVSAPAPTARVLTLRPL